VFCGIFHIQPLKMDLTEGSETSAKHNMLPGKYPKEQTQYSELGESFKSRSLINLPYINFKIFFNCSDSTLFPDETPTASNRHSQIFSAVSQFGVLLFTFKVQYN
jgi:hypothetical protein